jgi:hypothetical protein
VAKDHPLWLIRMLVNEAVAAMAATSRRSSGLGRPLIAPQKLLRTSCYRRFIRSAESDNSWIIWRSIFCPLGLLGSDR